MRANFVHAAESRERYNQWKSAWKLPKTMPHAMRGKTVVEFMPFQSGGSLFVKEGESKTAIVIHDFAGDVTPGTEVAIGAFNGVEFDHEGRRLTIIDQNDILVMEVAA